jgi:transcriptional regulator with XRE-family HTH domain
MNKSELPSHVKTLGDAIRFFREKRGMSLRQLASQAGVSAPFLSDIERNRRSTDKLQMLATALKVDVEVLRTYDGRIGADLREWIAANPGMVAVLREMRASGRRPDKLLSDLHKHRR